MTILVGIIPVGIMHVTREGKTKQRLTPKSATFPLIILKIIAIKEGKQQQIQIYILQQIHKMFPLSGWPFPQQLAIMDFKSCRKLFRID